MNMLVDLCDDGITDPLARAARITPDLGTRGLTYMDIGHDDDHDDGAWWWDGEGIVEDYWHPIGSQKRVWGRVDDRPDHMTGSIAFADTVRVWERKVAIEALLNHFPCGIKWHVFGYRSILTLQEWWERQ